nr:hypothetical protein [uncultured Rhizobium sp.]
MKKYFVSAVVAGLTLAALAGSASAQRYLDVTSEDASALSKTIYATKGFVAWDAFRAGAAAIR